jgi:hypothetical protein
MMIRIQRAVTWTALGMFAAVLAVVSALPA